MTVPAADNVSATPEPEATVMSLPSGWSLVSYGSWAVSVGPDSLLMLPRSLKPDEAEDFCAAVMAASVIGAQVKAENEERGKNDDRGRPSRRVIVREGGDAGVPAGAVRLPTRAGPTGSIGRRRGHKAAPRGSQGFPAATPTPRQSRER
jgi:hypothetical protein